MAIYKASGEAWNRPGSQPSERTDPASALISGWFKPLGLWSLVMVVPGDMYNAGQGWMRELRACKERA